MKNRKPLLVTAFLAGSIVVAACTAKNPNDSGGGPTGTGTATPTATATPTGSGSGTPTPVPTSALPGGVPIELVQSWPGFHGDEEWLIFKTGFGGSIVNWGTSPTGALVLSSANCGASSAGGSPEGDLVAGGSTFTNISPVGVVTTNWIFVGAPGMSGCNPAGGSHSWYIDFLDTAGNPSCVGGGCSPQEDFQNSVELPAGPASFYQTTPTVLVLADAFHAEATGDVRMFLTSPPKGPDITLNFVVFYTTQGADIQNCPANGSLIAGSTSATLIEMTCPLVGSQVPDPLYGGPGSFGSYFAYMVGSYTTSGTAYLQMVPFNYTPFQTTNTTDQ